MRQSMGRQRKDETMESQKDTVKKGVDVITGLSEDSTASVQ
jgi:hypothetical protein